MPGVPRVPGVPRLPRALQRAGLVGGALGIVAASAALGVVTERGHLPLPFVRRLRAGGEPLGSLRGEARAVLADDGVALHVEVDECAPEDAGTSGPGLSLVFCHGYSLNLDAFHFQRLSLRARPGPVARLVLYDQRGHGRSGRGPREHATIDQLGSDLRTVLEEAVPDGPVLLVGHSMGGMTVMALADEAPQLFGPRIVGVALISTSPGRLAEVTLGVPAALGRVLHRLAPRFVTALSRQSGLVERGRRFGTDLEYLLTRRYSFASPVPAEVAEFAARLIASTPVDVLAELFPAFDAHDKLRALEVLRPIDVLVLCGEDDLVTPAQHSRDMQAALPRAELVLVPHAGHLPILEHPEVVDLALRGLIRRCAGALEVA